MLIMYWAARIYTMNLENQSSPSRDLLCSIPRPMGSTITLRAKVEVQPSRPSSLRRTAMHNRRPLVSYKTRFGVSLRLLAAQEAAAIAGPAQQPKNSFEPVCY
jgi:hypothetical protein